LEGVVADPELRLSRLPLLTAGEREQLARWNATEGEYASGLCIHELFEQQALLTPQAEALRFDGASLSYAELNARANRLAHRLRSQGVGPETLVGLCLERSAEMV